MPNKNLIKEIEQKLKNYIKVKDKLDKRSALRLYFSELCSTVQIFSILIILCYFIFLIIIAIFTNNILDYLSQNSMSFKIICIINIIFSLFFLFKTVILEEIQKILNKKYDQNYSNIENYLKSVKEAEFIDNLPEILNIESGHEIVSIYCKTNMDVFLNNIKYITEHYFDSFEFLDNYLIRLIEKEFKDFLLSKDIEFLVNKVYSSKIFEHKWYIIDSIIKSKEVKYYYGIRKIFGSCLEKNDLKEIDEFIKIKNNIENF